MNSANDARRIVNLAQLQTQCEKDYPFVAEARAALRDSSVGSRLAALRHLLRDHEVESVQGEEIRRREGIDRLLYFFGLVELGIWTGDLPTTLPDDFAIDTLRVLSNPAVKTYYEVHYALALPGLLRRRLEGAPAVSAASQSSAGCFGMFLELSQPLYRDRDLDAFFWLLDDGTYGDIGLADMTKVLGERHRFLQAVSTKPQNRSYDEAAAVGFSKFLAFSVNFHSLMRRTEALPMLRAGFWYAHAYWFGKLSEKLRLELDRGIQALAWKRDAWEESGFVSTQSRHTLSEVAPTVQARSVAELAAMDAEAERARRKLQRVVGALTSSRYATPLRGKLETTVRNALHSQSSPARRRGKDLRQTNQAKRILTNPESSTSEKPLMRTSE